jgi:membrane protein implicated in regulation of membrane protease activity
MEGLVLTWWMWFLFGLVLLLAEFATPGAFYQFFFGVGALAVALIELVGLELPLWGQLLLFLVLSIGSLLALRRPLRFRFEAGVPDKEVDSLVGETATALEEIAADAIGKAELRGSSWRARNIGVSVIAPSQRVRVERVEGLILQVRDDLDWKKPDSGD